MRKDHPATFERNQLMPAQNAGSLVEMDPYEQKHTMGLSPATIKHGEMLRKQRQEALQKQQPMSLEQTRKQVREHLAGDRLQRAS
jgi:hypothetical protein